VRWWAFALVVLAAGCGDTQTATSRKPARSQLTCTRAAPGFRTCLDLHKRNHHPTIERRSGGAWTVVASPLPHAEMSTDWAPEMWVSPDGETLLAGWTFPCDSAVAVFVPLHGGRPRIVTGHRDWRKAPISRGLGWTSDGKARIRIFGKPGVQLIDPHAVERLPVRTTSC